MGESKRRKNLLGNNYGVPKKYTVFDLKQAVMKKTSEKFAVWLCEGLPIMLIPQSKTFYIKEHEELMDSDFENYTVLIKMAYPKIYAEYCLRGTVPEGITKEELALFNTIVVDNSQAKHFVLGTMTQGDFEQFVYSAMTPFRK